MLCGINVPEIIWNLVNNVTYRQSKFIILQDIVFYIKLST
jgi:hypothetical protein